MYLVRLFQVHLFILVFILYSPIYKSFIIRGKIHNKYSDTYLYSTITEPIITPKPKPIPGNDDRPPKFGKTYEEEKEDEIQQLIYIKKSFQQKKLLYELLDDRNNIQMKLNLIRLASGKGLIKSSSIISAPDIWCGKLTEDWIDL